MKPAPDRQFLGGKPHRDPGSIVNDPPILTYKAAGPYNRNTPGSRSQWAPFTDNRQLPIMPISMKRLHTKDQTAAEMYRLVDRYAGDLHEFDAGGVALSQLSLPAFYAAIRAIPYRQDTTGIEIVTRPYLMLTAPGQGWDCKKKAIAIASWLALHGIPYRFVAVSRRPSGDIHHVLTQAHIDGEWVDIDPTYPRNQLFEREAWTAVEPLAGDGRPANKAVLVSMAGDGAPGPQLTYEYVAALSRSCPEYLGDGGISAGGIVAIIVAAVSAAAAVTVAIIEGVQSRKDREARERTEAAQITSYENIQLAALVAGTEQQQIAADAQEAQHEMIKKWILPAGIAAGALILLR